MPEPEANDIKALTFDVFGTVVDWHGSVAREMRALGIESAYSLVDLVGEERAFADPSGALAELAERTARTWSR